MPGTPLTATYSGDANFNSSATAASGSTSVTVAPLDFTMTLAGPPTGNTVIPGSSITYTVKVTPLYGSYAGTVNFAVAGLPPGATVTFSPSTIPASSGPQTVTVTIQTAPATAANHAPPPPGAPGGTVPLTLAAFLLLGLSTVRKRSKALRNMFCVALLMLGGAMALVTTGCGGHAGFFAQAQKNYTVTITATSGTLQHSDSFTLNLQ